MSDRPILFSAPMVRAILAGRKNQTRRALKLRKGVMLGDEQWPREAVEEPRIAVGDRLWVREAWRTTVDLDTSSPSKIAASCLDAGYRRPWAPVRYEADDEAINWDNQWAGRVRASMHMPRFASRLTLTVTDVRVQRLQEISEADAEAEGVPACARRVVGFESGCSSFICGYGQLWQEIHRPKQKPGVYTPYWKGVGSWASDPWVACYSFTVEQRNIDA